MSTAEYRAQQIDKLKADETEGFRPAVKFLGGAEGETNWMTITDNELAEIRHILTRPKVS